MCVCVRERVCVCERERERERERKRNGTQSSVMGTKVRGEKMEKGEMT